MKKTVALWICGAVFSLFGFVIGVKTALDREEWTMLEIKMTSSVADEVQLFFDRGAGYNADDLRRARTFQTGSPETILIRLPHVEINSLRIDPMQREAEGIIHQARIMLPRSQPRTLDLAGIRPVNDIAKTELTESGLAFLTVPGAVDPYFLLSSETIPASASPSTSGLMLSGLVGFLIASGIALLVGGGMFLMRRFMERSVESPSISVSRGLPEQWRQRLTGGALAEERRGLLQIFLAGLFLRLCLMPFFGHIDVLSEARRIHYFWENQFWFDLDSARNVTNVIQLAFYSFTHWFIPDPDGLFYLRDVASSTATFQEFFAFTQTPGAWVALFFIKVPFLVMDLATLVVLWHCVSGQAGRRRMAWWWLFNPVTLFAFYIFGRFEAIPVFFIALMVWALLRERWIVAAIGLALAANGRETFALLLPLFVLFFLNPGIKATRLQRAACTGVLAMGAFLALNLHAYLGFGGSGAEGGGFASVMGESRAISLIGFALHWFSIFVFCYGMLALWLFAHPIKKGGEAGLLVLHLFWFAFFAFTTTTSHFTAWMMVFPLLAAARNPAWTRPLIAFFFVWAAMWAFMTDAGVFTQWLFVPFSLHWTELPSIPQWYQAQFEGRTFLTLTFVIWCWQTLFVAVLTYLSVMAWKDYRQRVDQGGEA